jgi:type I restriction enzyme S subunit
MSWELVMIKDICFIHGGNPSPKEQEFASDGIPFIKMKDLGKYHHTTSLEVVENRIPLELFNTRKFKLIKKGSVIIPRSGSVGLNHRGILAFDSVIVSHICALEIIDENLVLNKFLYYYLTTIDMVKITKQTTGLDAITFEDLGQIQIPLPPLATQKRIAEILDAADALRRKDQELLKKYDELAQAIFMDMFGDPVKNEKGWEVKKLDEVIMDIVAGTSYGGEDKLLESDELGVLKISAITSGFFKPMEYKAVKRNLIDKKVVFVKKGDFLFSRANTRELVGATCIVDADYETLFLPDKLWRIDFNIAECNPVFMKFLLSHKSTRHELSKTATGTSGSMLNISMQKLKEQVVVLPQINIQNKFGSLVNNLILLQNIIVNAEKKSQNIFASLNQKAFKGELV